MYEKYNKLKYKIARFAKDSSRSDQAESKEKETIPVIGEKKRDGKIQCDLSSLPLISLHQ